MAKTTEQEWCQIILENWSSFGKSKICKEDIYKNPIITSYCNSDDLRMSKSRKGEEAYKQQIGNIISHRKGNKYFDFGTFGTRKTYFWPKKINQKLQAENKFAKAIERTKKIEDIEKAIIEFEADRKMPKKKRNIRNIYATSQVLKNAMKAIADFSCEFHCDMDTHSFKIDEGHYVEVHHVIPMKNQIDFKENLDTKNNLIVLCPKHHKMFHYGTKTEREKLIELLPERNVNFLKRHKIISDVLSKIY